jgi:CHAD domain-containing protein
MDGSLEKTVRKTAKQFYGYRRAALTFKDPEDIHQMRVKGRTLLTFLDVISDDEEKNRPGFKKMRSALKKGSGLLGELRDLDVLITETITRVESMEGPQRELILSWLDSKISEQKSLRKKVKKRVPVYINPEWRARVRRWMDNRLPCLIENAPLRDNVNGLRKAMEDAFSSISVKCRSSEDMENEELLAQLHNARIRVKRLRYALSSFKGFIEVNDDEIEKLKKYQDGLGHIHDLSVWIARLKEYSGDNETADEIIKKWRNEMFDTLKETGLACNPVKKRALNKKTVF